MSLAEYLLLAIASIFWPLLFAIVLVALSTRHPVRLLTAFLIAGLLTTITIGVVIVFALEDKDAFARSSNTGRPALYILVGLLSIFAARYLAARPPAPAKSHGDPRLERYVASTRVAFGAGIVLNILPGFFPFVALVGIAKGGYSLAAEFVLVGFFYVIMFAFVEVPLVGYAFAPTRTEALTNRFNAWLDRNGRLFATYVLAGVGVYLIVRGIVAL